MGDAIVQPPDSHKPHLDHQFGQVVRTDGVVARAHDVRLDNACLPVLFDEIHGQGVLLPFKIPHLKDNIPFVAFFADAKGFHDGGTAGFLIVLADSQNTATTRPEAGVQGTECLHNLIIA